MKQPHTPIPRYRTFDGPAILRQGFRPFFLLAGTWAPLTVIVTIWTVTGSGTVPSAFPPGAWHFHEMLFGYVAAAIAGFLLTAVPNWTGRLPLQGFPLLGLVLLWIGGRVASATSAVLGAGPAAVIDVAFLAVLALVFLREIVAGRNWRNLPVVGILILLAVGNALFHAEAAGILPFAGGTHRVAIAVVIVLISLVGGRIIPSFTRNWLAKQRADGLPASFGNLDRVAMAVTIGALGYWVYDPYSSGAAALAAVAAAVNFLRLARWSGHATGSEPLVWVMHIGFLWIPIGLALLALSHWWPPLSQNAALHALTAGAMGTMTIAVMSRATMGHTGSPLHAGPSLTAAFVLVTLSATLRVSSGLVGEFYTPALIVSAALWVSAFVLFLIGCSPMLLKRG